MTGVSATMYLLTPCPVESRSESFINLAPSLTAMVLGRKRTREKISDHFKAIEAVKILKEFSINNTLPFEVNILSDEEIQSFRLNTPERLKQR